MFIGLGKRSRAVQLPLFGFLAGPSQDLKFKGSVEVKYSFERRAIGLFKDFGHRLVPSPLDVGGENLPESDLGVRSLSVNDDASP